MDKFKVGDRVIFEGNDLVFTVAEALFEGRWFVRLEGEPPNSWICASALRPYIAPSA